MKKHRFFPKMEDKVFFYVKHSHKPYKAIRHGVGRISRRKENNLSPNLAKIIKNDQKSSKTIDFYDF